LKFHGASPALSPYSFIGIYSIPLKQIIKDIFKKTAYFFNAQICPDERPGQAIEQKDDGVRQGVAHDQRKPAESAEIQDAAEHGKDIHKNALPALPQRQPHEKKGESRNQPEQKIRDGGDGFRFRPMADHAQEIV